MKIKFNRYQRATIGEYLYLSHAGDLNTDIQIKLINLFVQKRLLHHNDGRELGYAIERGDPSSPEKLMQIVIDKLSTLERKAIVKEFESKN